MTTTSTPEPAHFGRLLTWRRCDTGYQTRHAGRRYEIVKLTRPRAAGLNTRPGWHFTGHPDSPPADRGPWPGPALGAAFTVAKQEAELWILTPEKDHRPVNGSPSIRLVYGYGGAGFRSPSGARLLAEAREDGTIAIHSEDPGPGHLDLVGTVCPVATGDDVLPITWHPRLADGTCLDVRQCWQAAARAVAVHAIPDQEAT